MTDREKLIELVNNVLRCLPWGEISSHTAEDVADHLIANGVTIATDNNVGDKSSPAAYKLSATNADRIRAMSDEELAAWLVKKTKYQESAWSAPSYLNFLTESDDLLESAIKGTKEWLKQPVED